MSIQPFLQIWFGRPKIRIGFCSYNIPDNGIEFVCEIYNEPITKGILNFLRIYRDVAQDAIPFFTVSPKNTGIPFYFSPNTISIKSRFGDRAERVTLPASIFPSTFVIAKMDNKGQGSMLLMLLIFMMLIFFIMPILGPPLAVGFGSVAEPVIGFNGQFPVLTIFFSGLIVVFLSSLLTNFFTDWKKMGQSRSTVPDLSNW